ncbi:MAG: hypothetical protein EOP53_02290 [Sphingobacteriales bacterium]|nr:MAG: hypothetical protein EOP53_02290 [Sphingobacteriales bacterium]
MKKYFLIICILVVVLLQSCMTYYARNRKFNEFFQQGNIAQAEELIAKDKKSPKRNARLLYFLNRGVVAQMLGKYDESNKHFDTALIISETFRKNYVMDAASFLSNPNITPYKGEDFELLMVHYYKAFNYLYLKKYDEALVECRQMNLKLQVLGDKYKKDNRYKKDAFVNNLMGIIYEADGDYNNAFIAYRNALEIYENDYSKLYNVEVPEQLKQDLIRTAKLTGFGNEVDFYEKKFNMKYQPKDPNKGDLVFFWMNGLGPVKDEWSINFVVQKPGNNTVIFYNADLGISFPFYHEYDEKDKKSAFAQVEFVRVVLPRYLERPMVYTSAELKANGNAQKLQLGQDISKIAYQSLQDRMWRELGQSLLRLALKKAAEYSAREQNQNAGAAVGLLNFITEQADTRNWQTLPHSIYYSRMELPEGEQNVELNMRDSQSGRTSTQSFKYDIRKGRTTFQSFHSIAAYPATLISESAFR